MDNAADSSVFELSALLDEQARQGVPAYEFLRRASLSALVYRLAPGEPDRQRPHTEDEWYYVIEGEGTFECAGERTTVRPGSVIFVARNVPHRFLDYPNGITLLVVFAPARGTGGA